MLLILGGCVVAEGTSPYRSVDPADDDDVSDDDDSGSGDDDDSGSGDDDDSVADCDLSWLVVSKEPVSLQDDLVPIFVGHCFDCHMLVEQGGLSLLAANAYKELVGVPNSLGYRDSMPRVTAGDPEQSYLLNKILGCDQADPNWGFLQGDMPPSLLPDSIPLTNEQKSLIWSWIEQGAEDN